MEIAEAYKQLEKCVREKCRVTWNDEETDARITSITENAVYYLHHKLGMSGDVSPESFLATGMTRLLFENFCMYEWNDAAEDFENNYKREILMVRHKNEVENARSEKENIQ